jgi:uncharacterized phage protein gp47/JayE
MPLLIQKSMIELMQSAMSRLANTPISETSAGGIARLLLAVFNNQLASDSDGLYKTLSTAHAQSFLSTADGGSLDLIGELLACAREVNEPDGDYRYRISKQTLTLASANATAIRLAALSVEGVKDVIMKPYTHGTGSGSLYVITDNPSQAALVLGQVQNAVEDVMAYGVRISTFSPLTLPVEIYARLIFDKKASDLDQRLVRNQATQALKDYVNSRGPGESLVINEMIQRLMQVSDLIHDVEIIRFSVSDRPVVVTNQSCIWNERFVESAKPGGVVAA